MQCSSRRAELSYAAFDMVVVAASAGGVGALISFLENLPSDFSAPIVVVQHLPPGSSYISHLQQVLQRHTRLMVKWAENWEKPEPGTVYIAPQDRNTVLTSRGLFAVLEAPGVKRAKPLADPLFRSAAELFGSRTLAIVLSGVLTDGAEGSAAIARAGGRVLAQTATEARFADMPKAAMSRSRVGLAFNCCSLGRLVSSLVMVPGVAAWFGVGLSGVCEGLVG